MHSSPTRYKGTLFSTVIEAQWAVFFDLLGLSFCYNNHAIIQQFQPRNGRSRLRHVYVGPNAAVDFWFPRAHICVTVKSNAAQVDMNECSAFMQSYAHPLFCVAGRPWPGHYKVFLFGPDNCYPSIYDGLFAEAIDKQGWCIAGNDVVVPFRKVFTREAVDRHDVIVHSQRLLEAMRTAYHYFNE